MNVRGVCINGGCSVALFEGGASVRGWLSPTQREEPWFWGGSIFI